MVARTVIAVDAVFEDGLLRPLEALPFEPNKRLTLQISVPTDASIWPADTAEIYAELDRGNIKKSEAEIDQALRKRISTILGDYLHSHGGSLKQSGGDQPDFEVHLPRSGELAGVASGRPPCLIVELPKHRDTLVKWHRRMKGHLSVGVAMVWAIDGVDRLITVFVPNSPAVSLDETDDLTGGEILPGFRCNVSEFFAWPTTITDTPRD